MFHPSYHAARAAFREAVAKANGVHEALVVVEGDSPEDTLTIDIGVIGTGPRVLGLSSGLHGIEGFAGSGVQLQFMSGELPSDLRVVLIHALNPYGMHHLRRVNESNVDLNRNFLPPGEPYTGCTDEYRRLNNMLNPARPTRSFEFMIPQAIWQIIRHGMPALKTGLVGGQYEFPKGLFFGGQRLERGPALFMEALPRLFGDAEKIVHIDFHTGLGKSGSYALLVDTQAGSADHLRLRQVYGLPVQPWDAGSGVAYKIRGGLPQAMQRALPKQTDILTCEFGTVPALRVIDALRAENQATHWGGDLAKAKTKLTGSFRPASKRWEAKILSGGAFVIGQAIDQLRVPH